MEDETMNTTALNRIGELADLLSDLLIYTLDEREKPVHPDDAQRVFDRAEFVLAEISRTAAELKAAAG